MSKTKSGSTDSGIVKETCRQKKPKLRDAAGTRTRRAGAFIMALVILVTTCFSSLPEGSLSGLGGFGEQIASLFGSVEAEAATTTMHLTSQYGSASISEIGRSNEGLWFFTTNSTPSGAKSTVFCLDSGASLHQDKDTYKYTTSNAVTYSDTNLAKALTWWFGTHSDCAGESGITYKYNGKSYTLTAKEVHAAVQGYAWAYKKGKNVTTTVKQVLMNYCGETSSAKAKAAADTIVSAIADVHVYGTIYEYTCQSCGKGYSASDHQKMLGWSSTEVEPKYAKIQYDKPTTGETTITVTINKKDATSGSAIDTAKFSVQFGGAAVSNSTNVKNVSVKSGNITGWSIDMTTGTRSNSTFTTSKGVVKFTYTLKYETKNYKTQVYTYVTNWSQLSYWQKKTLTSKGYYSNKSDADSDAKAELKKGWDSLKSTVVNSIQSKKITVTETYCPTGYGFPSTKTQSAVPTSKKVSFTFKDPRKYGKVTITKTAKLDASYTGDDATLKGAVYEIRAGETINIYGTKYSAGDVIYYNGKPVTATTNANGIATTSAVLPAGFKYYAIETKASPGYELDTEKHYFTIGLDHTTGTVTNGTVSSKEPQTWGYVSVTKTKENADGTTSLEKGATFYVVKASDLLAYFGTDSEDDVINALNGMGESDRQDVIDDTGYAGGKALVTDASGYAKSGKLPAGDYFLVQTDGDDACELATPKFVSITSGSGGTDNYKFTNPRKTASVRISKTMTGYKSDGTTYKTPEAGATFVVLYASAVTKSLSELSALETAKERQEYVYDTLGSSAIFATLVTDENGEASEEVDAGVEYIVYQIDGEEGYALAAAKSIKLEEGETDPTYYLASNPEYQNYFEITKLYEDTKGKEHAEEGAEFVIVEASGMTESISDVTLMDADDRTAYVNGLADEFIIGTITADSDGKAFLYWPQLAHSGDFVVIQTSGTDGCALMPVISSADATEDGSGTLSMKVTKLNDYESLTSYTFSYTDEYTEWGKIAVQKYYESANGVWSDEEGAEFTVTDYFTGEEVAWAVTDSTGYGVACDADGNEAKLPYGSYLVTQTASGKDAENTSFADPEIVILTKYEWQQTVLYTAKNPEDGYLFELTKLSDDTGAAVSGATYAIIAEEDILNGDGGVDYAKGKTVATITTGEDGTGEIWLPHGYYHIEETESPVTFVKSEEVSYFTLDADGISIVGGITTEAEEHTETDEDGNTTTYYSVSFTTTDTPVYGSIYVTKDGQVVSGKAESGGFTYKSETLEGAEFTLYAQDDITDDAGNVIWPADPDMKNPIAVAVTDSTGSAQFYWNKDGLSSTGEDGNECADFYLGNYYVVETYAPYGYVCDTTPHEIGLTWNTSAESSNDMSDPNESSTLYGTENDWESSGESVLLTGEELNSLISDAVTITFTWSSPADGTNVTDVSHDQDGSVVMWDDGSGNYYVSTCDTRQAVIFNGNSSRMFYQCTSLTEITFDAVDTTQVIDMSYMFYMCTGLTELDLTNFDTTNVQYTDYMFMGCMNLVTIYVTEPGSTGTATEPVYKGTEYTSGITATAAGTVMDGDEITWENFYYTRLYRVDYIVEDNMESIELSESDIASVTPSVASQDDALEWIDESTYTIEVEITLDESCAYYCTDSTYSNVLTAVVTVTIPDEDAELETQAHAMATLALSDTPLTVGIEVYKQNESGDNLAGAEFTLYANCDILNADGEVLYSAGQEIMGNTSLGETAPIISFSGLPTNLYAADGTYLDEQDNAVYCYADGTTANTSSKGTTKPMFYIKETKAPDGYELNDSTWYVFGDIEDYVAADDKNFDGVITYTFTAVDTWIEYLVLQKAWDDADDSDNRPDYVTFLATGGTSTYTVALFEDKAYLFDYTTTIGRGIYTGDIDVSDGKNASALQAALCSWDVDSYTENSDGRELTVWSVALDDNFALIGGGSSFASPFTESSGYTFMENTTLLKSMTIDNEGNYYYQTSTGWMNTDHTVWRTTNYFQGEDCTSAAVQKTWDDNGDEKGIRPDAIYVTLWQEDSQGNKVIYSTGTTGVRLSANNDWYYSTDRTLPIEDNYGGEYTYYWKENGKAQEASDENIPPEDYSVSSYTYAHDDVNDVWYTEITNTTEITVPVTVSKTWSDYGNVDGSRPDTIYVRLYIENRDKSLTWVDLNGDVVMDSTTADTAVALNAANGWSVTLGETVGTNELPKYDSSGNEITYKFAEVTSAATLIVGGQTVNVKAEDVSWYTGDEETGYKASSVYSIGDTGSAVKNTAITNTHTPTGEITIEKTVDADDVIYYAKAHEGEEDENPVFTFSITDPDNNTETFTLTFDANELTAGSGYITASATYSGLGFGEYTIAELSQPEGWEFTGLTCTNDAADIDGMEVSFTLDEDNIVESFVATYTDEYAPVGGITVSKTISEEELETYRAKYNADPSVTFTLSLDAAGTDVVETRTVTFTADSIAKYGYVTESAVFTDLEPGTYYLAETSVPDTWEFVGIGSVANGTVDTETGKTVQFEITKENALETFEATFTDKYPTGEITVYKKVLVEEMEAYNEDAEFTFTLRDESGKEVDEKTVTIALSDCAGLASGDYITASATFEALELGEYYLEETKMPAEWEFVEIASVTADGVADDSDLDGVDDRVKFTLTEATYTKVFEAVYVDEYINGSITVIKYGNDGKTKLDGVTFTLYDENGEVVAEKTTGKNGEETGQVAFTELKKGTYTLTETSTLDGYSLLVDTVTITLPLVVTADEIDAYAAAGIVVDTTDAISKGDEYWFYDLTYTVTDSAVISLPSTGKGMAWYALLLIIGGLVLANICAFSMRLKRIRIEERQPEE